MQTLSTLFWLDRMSLGRYLSIKTTSKLIVALLFLCLFSGIALGLYGAGSIFFRNLATFEQYGQLTAVYIVHAAVVITLLLSLVSSIVASLGLLVGTSPSMSYLLSLPVKRSTVSVWLFVKTIAANLVLMCFIFIPILVSYALPFGVFTVGFVIRAVLGILAIVLLSASVGMLIALPLARRVRGHEYLFGVLGFVIFFAAMVGILRVVFPPELFRLYDVTITDFSSMFSRLPLNNPAVPTRWLVDAILFGQPISVIFVSVVVAIITLGSVLIQTAAVVPTIIGMWSEPIRERISPSGWKMFLRAKDPMILKDWFSIVRLPSEIGYGLFLGSVALFFFASLTFGIRGEPRFDVMKVQLTLFSFAWLFFFATSILLRFVFPLMAREGKSAWYLFSLPLKRQKILASKAFFSLIVAGILAICDAFIIFSLPFASGYRLVLILMTLPTFIFLSVSHMSLGAVFPNFSMSEEPEKISTSGMGLFALGVSVLWTVVAGIFLYRIMTGQLAVPVIFWVVLVGGFVSLFLYLAAIGSVRQYEL